MFHKQAQPELRCLRVPCDQDAEIVALHREVYVDECGYFKAGSAEGPPPVSPHSTLHAAFVGGTCVGTLEVIPEAHYNGPSRHLLPIESLRASARGGITVASKLIVRRAFRGRLGIELTKAAYVRLLEDGVHYCILECYDHLVALYERLGFRRQPETIEDAIYGRVNIMVLDVLDIAHLCAVGSPFLTAARRACAV